MTSVSRLQEDLPADAQRLASMPGRPPQPPPPISLAMPFGEQKYTEIHIPILAIFAVPHNFDGVPDPATRGAMLAVDLAHSLAQAKVFERGLTSAHVVRLPNADHDVFNSNEADVQREMNAFLARLP
jgi:hypothetical protein